MTLPHPLPDELVALVARRFHVLGEPTRVRLLDRLREGEATVHELAEAVGSSQQNVSKHLQLLADGGVVARRRAGNHVFYAIADDGVLGLCEQVCGSIERHLLGLAALVQPAAGVTHERSLQ